jgi:hypothetical protein
MTLTVASFNCGNDDPERTPGDLDLIGADVYCLEETGDRHEAIDAWCDRRNFEQVPFRRGAGDTPILFDPVIVTLSSFTHHQVMGQNTLVGAMGAGPTTVHPKFVTHATFGDNKTGRTVNVLNTHVIASWTRRDLPGPEKELRRSLGSKHIDVLVDAIASLDAAVVVCGDFNAQKSFPLMKPLVDAIDLGDTQPTAGARVIDFVGVRGEDILRVQREVVTGTSSDHHAIVAHLTLRASSG